MLLQSPGEGHSQGTAGQPRLGASLEPLVGRTEPRRRQDCSRREGWRPGARWQQEGKLPPGTQDFPPPMSLVSLNLDCPDCQRAMWRRRKDVCF